MEWTNAFIVYRIGADGTLTEVFHHDDLQKAKYWLAYIAESGDVLCRTPAHPKRPPSPQYVSHKHGSGKPVTNLEEWENAARQKGFSGNFPAEQLAAAAK